MERQLLGRDERPRLALGVVEHRGIGDLDAFVRRDDGLGADTEPSRRVLFENDFRLPPLTLWTVAGPGLFASSLALVLPPPHAAAPRPTISRAANARARDRECVM